MEYAVWGSLSHHASWGMGPDLWLTPSTLHDRQAMARRQVQLRSHTEKLATKYFLAQLLIGGLG